MSAEPFVEQQSGGCYMVFAFAADGKLKRYCRYLMRKASGHERLITESA